MVPHRSRTSGGGAAPSTPTCWTRTPHCSTTHWPPMRLSSRSTRTSGLARSKFSRSHALTRHNGVVFTLWTARISGWNDIIINRLASSKLLFQTVCVELVSRSDRHAVVHLRTLFSQHNVSVAHVLHVPQGTNHMWGQTVVHCADALGRKPLVFSSSSCLIASNVPTPADTARFNDLTWVSTCGRTCSA